MRLTAATRLVLTVALWVAAIVLIVLNVQAFGIRTLMFAVVPLLATG